MHEKSLDDARKTLAQSIHAEPSEIIFTSGGTEADNTAIFGTAYAMKEKGIILLRRILNIMLF